MIGRWIAGPDQNLFKTVHRPRTQHKNAARGPTIMCIGKKLETLTELSKGFSFVSQDDFENLTTVPFIDKLGKIIPKHSELPVEDRAQLLVLYFLKKKRPKKESTSD